MRSRAREAETRSDARERRRSNARPAEVEAETSPTRVSSYVDSRPSTLKTGSPVSDRTTTICDSSRPGCSRGDAPRRDVDEVARAGVEGAAAGRPELHAAHRTARRSSSPTHRGDASRTPSRRPSGRSPRRFRRSRSPTRGPCLAWRLPRSARRARCAGRLRSSRPSAPAQAPKRRPSLVHPRLPRRGLSRRTATDETVTPPVVSRRTYISRSVPSWTSPLPRSAARIDHRRRRSETCWQR